MSAKIIFMGTPDFAVPSVTALIESDYDLVGVVTQPDRPQGRGKKVSLSPVKAVAVAAGVEVLQPSTLKTKAVVAQLAALEPDLIVVAAFGQILRKRVLEMPPHGCLNVHASLLPRWRGAAPVAAAIRADDAETGITLMRMDAGLDTGPMIAHQSLPILPTHTRSTLTTELAHLGATLLLENLPVWLAGNITAQPQADGLATYAPRLKKEAGEIDWQQTAPAIDRQIRAFYPWPGTFTHGPRGRFKVLAVEVASSVSGSVPDTPGTLFKYRKKVHVTTGQGVVRLVTVQPPGKKVMQAEAMLNGMPDLWGARLGKEE